MLNTGLSSERSPPEVMSRYRANASPSQQFHTVRAAFPEPTLSAADRAAAAASHSRSVSPHNSGGESGYAASYLGPPPPPRHAMATPPAQPAMGHANGAAGGTAYSVNGRAADAATPYASPSGGSAGATPDAGWGAVGAMRGRQSVMSEGSHASSVSEPAKPADYMSLLSMVQRVRRFSRACIWHDSAQMAAKLVVLLCYQVSRWELHIR